MEGDLKDLLGFLFQRADATQTFWNFYVGAVTAVLALVTAGRAEWLNRWVCLGLTAVFLVFAAGNFRALDSVRSQREQLIDVARQVKGYERVEKVVMAVRPPSPGTLYVFHGSLDVAVIVAIWGIPFARRRHELAGRPRGRT
jgi:hypothetical protein